MIVTNGKNNPYFLPIDKNTDLDLNRYYDK